jgi:purine-binding chemotaxis protein CheW
VSEASIARDDTGPGATNRSDDAALSGMRGPALLFSLDDQRYGLPLHAVDRVVHMVKVTALPRAPAIVLGVINVQGRVLPVLDLRRRFRRPVRDVALTDQLIIARTASRSVALTVDAVSGVFEYCARQAVAAHDIVPGVAYAEGVVKLEDGLVLIHDLDSFLSLDEAGILDAALREV